MDPETRWDYCDPKTDKKADMPLADTERMDHLTALGMKTSEMDDGSNAAFIAQKNGKDNQFNSGKDAKVSKNIYYDSETR